MNLIQIWFKGTVAAMETSGTGNETNGVRNAEDRNVESIVFALQWLDSLFFKSYHSISIKNTMYFSNR